MKNITSIDSVEIITDIEGGTAVVWRGSFKGYNINTVEGRVAFLSNVLKLASVDNFKPKFQEVAE